MGDVSDNSGKSIIFTAPKVNNLTHLWLVVMGAPTEHWMNPNPEEKDAQWPYRIKVTGSKPL